MTASPPDRKSPRTGSQGHVSEVKGMNGWTYNVAIFAGAILVVSLAFFVIRYASGRSDGLKVYLWLTGIAVFVLIAVLAFEKAMMRY